MSKHKNFITWILENIPYPIVDNPVILDKLW